MNRALLNFVANLAGWTAGGTLTWLVLRSLSWGKLELAFEHADWRAALIAVGVATLANYIKAYRWKLVLAGEDVSILRLFVVRTGGAGLSAMSPVRLLGESAQVALLSSRDRVPVPKLLASMTITHLMDIAVTAAIAAVGLIAVPALSGYFPALAALGAGSLVAYLASPRIAQLLLRFRLMRRWGPVRETLLVFQNTRASKRLAAACLTLTITGWLLIGFAAWLVAQSMDVGLPIWTVTVVMVAVMRFAGMVPAPPGVLGVYEFLVVTGLGLFGIAPTAAISFALVMHAVLFIVPVLLGAGLMVFEHGSLVSCIVGILRVGFLRPAARFRIGVSSSM